MSRENVELVRRVFEDPRSEANLALYSPDTVWDDRDLRPDGKIHRGREAMVAEMRAWFGTWKNWRWEIEDVRDAGDRVLVIGRETGEGKGSGVVIDQRIGLLFTVKGGQIVHTKVYREPADALRAAGLVERYDDE